MFPDTSIGSTPTISAARNLDGIGEVRPGNYAFFDVFQSAIGSCALRRRRILGPRHRRQRPPGRATRRDRRRRPRPEQGPRPDPRRSGLRFRPDRRGRGPAPAPRAPAHLGLAGARRDRGSRHRRSTSRAPTSGSCPTTVVSPPPASTATTSSAAPRSSMSGGRFEAGETIQIIDLRCYYHV